MGAELPSGHGMEFDPDSFTSMGLTNVNSAIVPVVVIGPDCFKYVGTAFNIAPDGLFVTARHVVPGAAPVLSRPGPIGALIEVRTFGSQRA